MWISPRRADVCRPAKPLTGRSDIRKEHRSASNLGLGQCVRTGLTALLPLVYAILRK